MTEIKDFLSIIRKHALINACQHEGKSEPTIIMGKVIAEKPELKNQIKDLFIIIKKISEEVNLLTKDEQECLLQSICPDVSLEAPKEKEREKKLPPLPCFEKYNQIITRFSPNPDCVLHLGSARAIILSHDYAKKYNGKFILRFEDTDPRLKKASLEFYDLIREDLKWLGCEWNEEYIQSDRLEIYYNISEKLIQIGGAYICTCESLFRNYITSGRACPCRDLDVEEQIRRWEKMLSGYYKEGQAIVRVKTDINHSNPAVRDWPALRIIDTKKYPHPRVGSKYNVWPLYNFSTGIDDHQMGITHIIRGKEHLTNTVRQEYLYKYFDWEYPTAIHYGRLKIENTVLSKSKIIQGIECGTYENFEDPRLATFLALKKRGIQPDAIRKLIYEVGIKPVDVTISWSNLYANNRQIIDKYASRYFAIFDKIELHIYGIKNDLKIILSKHPEDKTKGIRELHVDSDGDKAVIFISKLDSERLLSCPMIRLMELMNIGNLKMKNNYLTAEFKGFSVEESKLNKAPIIHWLPIKDIVNIQLIMPTCEKKIGIAEKSMIEESVDSIVQLERVGFGRIDWKSDDEIIIYFISR